ncbi:uncharacterized protein [Drosophila virilis]|uniref:WAP domain-containing protein n=1 Tax=Drosophila virilis TaxID=7244 RepID=A0A0Q9WT16_DROVI|nr:uncharacterized protein LOC26530810 [Drosophila virilis]KRF83296.1 uncharacterized protein Dvir_GJ26040 [Drosophila virilis]
MQLSRSTLWLLFGLGALFNVVLSGVVKNITSEAKVPVVSDAVDFDTSASIRKSKAQLPQNMEEPETPDAEIIPFRNDLTQWKRMELMDTCKGIGTNCTRSEECCTLQCLKVTKVCSF